MRKIYPAVREFTVPHRTGLGHGLKLLPAYGKVYETAEAAVEEWWDGEDFTMVAVGLGGKYCSIRDSHSLREREGLTHVILLFNSPLKPASGLQEAWVELVYGTVDVHAIRPNRAARRARGLKGA